MQQEPSGCFDVIARMFFSVIAVISLALVLLLG